MAIASPNVRRPETAAALSAGGSGLDPAKRAAVLAAKQTAAVAAEGDQTKKKAALKTATELSVAATGSFYKEASEAAGALATELGEDHAFSQEIHKIRPGMSNEAARGPHKPSTP